MHHHLLAVLVVTILSGGGPPRQGPSRIADATSQVTQNGKVVAHTSNGTLTAHLRAGTYLVTSAIPEPNVTPELKCEETHVRLKAGHTTHVKLYCSIP